MCITFFEYYTLFHSTSGLFPTFGDTKGVAYYSSQAKCHPLPAFLNRFYWNLARAVFYILSVAALGAAIAELSSCDRLYSSQNLKYLPCSRLQKKFGFSLSIPLP